MGLGKFDEDSLLEFREKALLHYSQLDLSDDYNLGNWARNAVNAVTSAASGLVNRVRGRGNTPTPITGGVGRRQTFEDGSSNSRTAELVAAPTARRDMANAAARISGGSGSGSGRASTPRPQPRGESAAEREARLRREREEAERRERERREAEERLRQQREATEAARKERLRSITKDVAQRILENALESANKGQPDSESQLCQRPDGSVYGIGKNQQCVTGKPIDQRPENDRTDEINEAARNNPDQQNLPVGWRTAPQGGATSTTSTPESSPSPANSADARVSGQQTETTADTQSNMA